MDGGRAEGLDRGLRGEFYQTKIKYQSAGQAERMRAGEVPRISISSPCMDARQLPDGSSSLGHK